MFESIIAAWDKTMAVTKKVMDRLWGEQTSQEASLMKRAERAEEECRAAAARLQEATSREDVTAMVNARNDLNRWRSELNRLRDEAAAKHP